MKPFYFLLLEDLDHKPELTNHFLHVVPKKMTKGSFIRETFFVEDNKDGLGLDSEAEKETLASIFIDDDIRELVLVKDTWFEEQIHRLLFVSAFL